MSAVACSSCGASNSGELVYCAACGSLLEKTALSGTPSAATAVARRRSMRIESDRRPAPGMLSRIWALVIYLFWVALGVIVVLASMDPGINEQTEQRVPDAEGVLQRVLAASRFTSSILTQPVINSVLSRREPFSPESPVRLIPMPVWDQARIELSQGTVTFRVTLTLLGRPIRISETFRPQGGPGSWSLQPVSATVGLLHLPDMLVAAVSPLIRPGFLSLSKDLEFLSGSRSLAIRPGQLEFTLR